MRFTTRTEYGLICLIYMANRPENAPVSIKEMVRDENYSQTYIEKIMQTLKAEKIVDSQHGNQGGYVLSRKPSQINLKEIIEALEGHTFDVFCEPHTRKDITCTHFPSCGVMPIWDKTKELLDRFYGSITLEMLARNDIQSIQTITLSST